MSVDGSAVGSDEERPMAVAEPLPLLPIQVASGIPAITALERAFPAAAVSQLAEVESWRKEIHRPATHTHKWWAQRLGTVFRAILIAAVTPGSGDALTAYSSAIRLTGLRVMDPFAGSGTTVVEAAKMGATAIGFDINPVATLVQRQAVAAWDDAELKAAFKLIEDRCREEIDYFHVDRKGCPVLYYFWVAVAQCPTCASGVDLFSTYVFARHAYAKKFPAAKATCPHCRSVVPVDLSADEPWRCQVCGEFVPTDGPVIGQTMTCAVGHRHRIIDALREHRPEYRMFAKLVLTPEGKRYESIDDFDETLFAAASKKLRRAPRGGLLDPEGQLTHGYNTVQAMRWGFRRWRDFFNDRQLYSLGLLGAAVRDLDCGEPEREALAALFSGTLEFNNLFASYKGEGTGAVRHMFSHHVLKPERTPLEAHPWGTPASSGSFSTLFESRLLRAHRYKQLPTDLIPTSSSKPKRVAGLSAPLAFELGSGEEVLISTTNSARMPLGDGSVDLVVTDPPYMDNVHYSELADFFHSWLSGILPFREYEATDTTRADGEVQDTTADGFGFSIEAVWRECLRVMKPSGLLAFTFHQAKMDGWVALMQALARAGFTATAMHPIKGEMSVAAPKHGAREPSTLDTVVVCREASHAEALIGDSAEEAAEWATDRLTELAHAGIAFGSGDVRSVVRGCVLALLTRRDLDLHPRDLVEAADRLASCAVESFTSVGRSSYA